MLEGWKVGRLEGWNFGRLEGWKAGRLEGWKVGRFKRFCHIPCFQKLPPSRAPSPHPLTKPGKAGMMEGWKVGRMIFRKSISANIHRFSLSYLTPLNETLLVGRFKRFCHIPCFQTLPPRRAPQARGEACVTVFERRSC